MSRYALTETGNAERFADHFRVGIRFVIDWKKYIIWSGKCWKPDDAEVRVQALVKEAHRSIYGDAKDCVDDRERGQIAAWAKASERRQIRESTVRLAKAEPEIAVSHNVLDRDPLLLNCVNGVVDLRDGALRKHEPEDLLTKLVPVAFDADAACPRFETFLTEILPDVETVRFCQRAIGYSLTGLTSEHCLFFAYGVGANGKSTLLNVMLALLGDYAVPAPSSLLMTKRGESHPTELATLYGRRLVVCQETDMGRGWAEATVKTITGGDQISARRMREDFWSFSPTHKLWLAANHKPPVTGTDEGIWRRLRLIPFEKVIPKADRDPHLAEELAAELPGILRWAVEGCLSWRREGLGEPKAVLEATENYRNESDRLGPFLNEVCVLDPAARVSRAALRQAYDRWASANGETRPLGSQQFTALLRMRAGVTDITVRETGSPVKGWAGLRLPGADAIAVVSVGTGSHPNGEPFLRAGESTRNTEGVATPAYVPTTSHLDATDTPPTCGECGRDPPVSVILDDGRRFCPDCLGGIGNVRESG